MSNFNCEHCGAPCLDSPQGYWTGCEHYPPDIGLMKSFEQISEDAAEIIATWPEWKQRTLMVQNEPTCKEREPVKPTDTDALIDYGSNAGIRCDTNDGPCACGAWH